MSTTEKEPTSVGSYDFSKAAYEPYADKGAGWMVFAAIMLGLGGLFGLLDGIVAVSKSSFYVANAQFVFSDLYTWGWIIMFAGGWRLPHPSS